MQSELMISWKNKEGKPEKPDRVVPLFQRGHKQKYMRALKVARDTGDISKSTYYKLKGEYDNEV